MLEKILNMVAFFEGPSNKLHNIPTLFFQFDNIFMNFIDFI